MRRLVALLLLLLLLLPPALGRHQLQWLSWSSWGSKHLSGQPELTHTHANLIQDQNISFLISSTSLPGMLLLPYRGPDSLFVTDHDVPAHTAGCRRLASDWERRLDGIIAQITAHQPHIRGVQLGDELVDGGLTVNNLSALATYLRQRLPSRVFIYTNEGFRYENPCLGPNHTTCKGSGAGPARCVQGRCIPAAWKYFPADIDAISLDGYANSVDEVTFARSQYERYFLPLLRPHQKIWVVPGIYGHNCSDGSTRLQNASCLAHTDSLLVAKLRGYLSWAEAEPRLTGIMAWHWPSLAGPPSGDWGMQMGGVAYPQLLGLVQQVVSELQPIALKLAETERRTHASKSKTDDTTSAELESVDLLAPAPPCAGILLWNGICSPVDYPNYSMADSYGGRVSSLQPLLPPYLTPEPTAVNPAFCAGCNEPGHDYSILNLTTVKACALACEYDSRCKSWTFSLPATNGKGCYLKDKVAPSMDCSRPKAVVSGCSKTLPAPIPAGCTCRGRGEPGGGPGSRPAVINISMGRQLFVDDFLIQSSSGVVRTFFSVNYDSQNPILAPTEPWELSSPNPKAVNSSTAMAYSGGVAYDAAESSPINRYKQWYSCGTSGGVCLARSADGLNWRKDGLGRASWLPPVGGPPIPAAKTNIVLDVRFDSSTVVVDPDAPPDRRFVMSLTPIWMPTFLDKRPQNSTLCTCPFGPCCYAVFTSADGMQWNLAVNKTGDAGDRSTMYYDNFRKKFVFSIRYNAPLGRVRYFLDGDSVEIARGDGKQFNKHGPVPWVAVDALDPPLVNGANHSDASHSELYNVDVVAYESVLVGLFTIMRGKQTPAYGRSDDKWHGEYDGVYLAFSRNGFDWFRPPPAQGDAYRKPFAGQVIQDPPVGDINAWNFFDVQSVGGGFFTHSSTLRFFFSGRSHTHLNRPSVPAASAFYYTNSSTGTGTLRRDGFAAMHRNTSDSDSTSIGRLETFLLRFDEGDTLRINANTIAGMVRVQVVDEAGQQVPGLGLAQCDGVSDTDSTDVAVTWSGQSALLGSLAGKPFQLTFELHGDAQLFSFWIGLASCGSASRGFVAAGSAEFPRPRDEHCNRGAENG